MANRVLTPGLLALFLAMQAQAGAAGNGNDSGDCTLLASIINVPVLYAAEEDLTGLRKNQNRLPNGAMTVYRPAGCNYTTTIEGIEKSRVLRGVPLYSGHMTNL